MVRKKLNLEYIANDSARKSTYKKRSKGLIKKVKELSILCGIDACAIIYRNDQPVRNQQQPEVFPSRTGVERVVSRFNQFSEMEQEKNMMDQNKFLTFRLGKTNNKLEEVRRENREKEVREVMFQLIGGRGKVTNLVNVLDLSDLSWFIDEYMKGIEEMKSVMVKNGGSSNVDVGSSSGSDSGINYSGGGGGERANDQRVATLVTLEVTSETVHQRSWFMGMMNPRGHFENTGDKVQPSGKKNNKDMNNNTTSF